MEVLFLSDDGAGDGDGGESAMLVDGLILAALKCNSAMLREALGRDAIEPGSVAAPSHTSSAR